MVLAFLQENDARVTLSAAAGQTVFQFDYPIFDKADLKVINIPLATGVATTLALGTDYSVQDVGAATGGKVTLVVAAALGDKLIIEREVELKRITDFATKGEYNAVTVNRELDRMVMMIQDLRRDHGRTLKAPDFDALDTISDLAKVADRDDKVLTFSGGQPVPGVSNSTLQTLITAALTGITLASSAAVASVATMKALDPTTFVGGEVILLTEVIRGGNFVVRAGTGTEDSGVNFTTTTASAFHFERLYQGRIMADWFGVVRNGTTDDAAAAQLALDAGAGGGLGGGVEFTPATYLFGTQLTMTTNYSDVSFTGCILRISHTAIGLKIGEDAARRKYITGQGGSWQKWDTGAGAIKPLWTAGSAAIQYINHNYGNWSGVSAIGFERGVSLLAKNTEGCTYNSVQALALIDNKFNVHMTQFDTGFCNSNAITASGSNTMTTSVESLGSENGALVYMKPAVGAAAPMDDNKIIGGALETPITTAAKRPKAVILKANGCKFDGCRLEGWSTVNEVAIQCDGGRGNIWDSPIITKGFHFSDRRIFTRITGLDSTFMSGGGEGATLGSGATGTAVLTAERVTSITVDTAGTLYNRPPLVKITGGAGTGAAGHAVMKVTPGDEDQVDTVVIDQQGRGYTSVPAVAFGVDAEPGIILDEREDGDNSTVVMRDINKVEAVAFNGAGDFRIGLLGSWLRNLWFESFDWDPGNVAAGATVNSGNIAAPNFQPGQAIVWAATGLINKVEVRVECTSFSNVFVTLTNDTAVAFVPGKMTFKCWQLLPRE